VKEAYEKKLLQQEVSFQEMIKDKAGWQGKLSQPWI
jgi:hypothetical protein